MIYYIYDQDSIFCESYFEQSIDEILTKFHPDDYIDLIKSVTPDNKHLYED